MLRYRFALGVVGLSLWIMGGIFFGHVQAAPTSSPTPTIEATATEAYLRARVEKIDKEGVNDVDGTKQPYQVVEIQFLDGPEAGSHETIHHGEAYTIQQSEKVRIGQVIIIDKTVLPASVQYAIIDVDRLPALWWLLGLFIFLILVVGRWRGASSLLGLALSILVLTELVVPRILAGSSPLSVSLVGSVIISIVSLYIAHGLNRRTSIGVASALISLTLAVLMAVLAAHFTQLSGSGSEEAFFLRSGALANLDLRGLLLGGIVLGVVGILDDITTAQAAAVEEIYRANPTLSAGEIYRRGLSIGREHIASLVNTLVLAYAGASFATFLFLNYSSTQPLWVTMNSEFFMEEIVRTLIGSATLVLAVPIATGLAALAFTRGTVRPSSEPNRAHHHH